MSHLRYLLGARSVCAPAIAIFASVLLVVLPTSVLLEGGASTSTGAPSLTMKLDSLGAATSSRVYLPCIQLDYVPCPTVCVDSDNDGYAIDGGACGPIDCNDANNEVNPGATEDCDNGIDDNCNCLTDASDSICSAPFNIILIGWDGTQRDHFWECYERDLPECSEGLPGISALSGGVIFGNTTTNGDTATKPGWAQILTGYDVEVTGVRGNGDYQPIPEGYTVFEKIEKHLGRDSVATLFVSGKGIHTGGACIGEPTSCDGQPCIEDKGQPWCLTKEHIDVYENDLRQNHVVGSRALELLDAHRDDLFFAFILFREPDVIGHLEGEGSVPYSESLIDLDRWLGRIVSKLQDLGIYERTLVYVTTDHGFDEGTDRHQNAPYGFFASNDPLIIRSGDRRDVAPTILARFGIGDWTVGGTPLLNGFQLFSVPPVACIAEGDSYIDYIGAASCCADLKLIGLDTRSGPDCIPATGGSGDRSGYCTACGNGICIEPENRCICPADCE